MVNTISDVRYLIFYNHMIKMGSSFNHAVKSIQLKE